ncbi:sugar transferase [Actinocatenispora rupis]|uniref:sugar transferase n=1 Tax=Actinocatenispora rupis TaxID=519421 RepID=UPI0019430E0F
MTTSLERPDTTRRGRTGRRGGGPSPTGEQRPDGRNNGITRSAWLRAKVRRGGRWDRWYAGGLAGLEFVLTSLAGLTSILISDHPYVGFSDGFTEHPPSMYVWGCLLLPLGWSVTLWGSRAYERRYLGIGTEEFKRVFRGGLIVVAVVSFIVMAFKYDLSRLAVGTALLCAFGYVLAARAIARFVLYLARRRGLASQRIMLVGTLPEAMEVYRAITRNPNAGLVPIGIFLTEGRSGARGVTAPVPLHAGRDLLDVVREIGADTIAVCGTARDEQGGLRRLAWQLEGTGIDLVVAPQLTDIAGPRVHIRPVEGLPLLHVEEPIISGLGWVAKNLLDRIAAALGLLVLTPLFAVIAIMIKVSDPGPVFFRQPRVGREGDQFHVWKFRTMYTDAEERLAHLVDQNETDGLLFKIRNDPRVIPIGRFLRRTSLDELPQLINVLKGEMSLVGPRPLPAEDGDFLGDVRRRLLVRPGITGLWQVSGRSDLSWDDAVRLDLYYVDNWSLTFDLLILWRTLGVVFARRGAY